MKLSKSQITSAVVGLTGIVTAAWPLIKPYCDSIIQNSWFAHHPTARAVVVIGSILIVQICRSLVPSKSGLPGQDPNATQ